MNAPDTPLDVSRPDASSSQPLRLPILPRMTAATFWTLVGLNVLWGGASLAAKVALGTPAHPGLPPTLLAFSRFSVAALLMYGVARVTRVNLAVARADWGRFWAMGILGLALTYFLSYTGQALTRASDGALIVATEPVFLALLAWLFLREPMPASKVGGIAAGLTGVFLIVANGWRLPALSGAMLGDALIAGALLFEAGSGIVGKGLVSRYPAVTVMTYQMASGAIALAPLAVRDILHAAPGTLTVTAPAALALLYLIVPCTVLAYTVWYAILERRGPGEMSVFLFIQPVVGTALGAILLHEPVTAWKIAGAALVMGGVALLHRRHRPMPEH